MDRDPDTVSRRCCLLAGLAWGAGVPGRAAARRSDESLNRVDREFVQAATRAGRIEYALSRLALRRAANPRIRDFAKRLLADYGRVHVELRRLAASRRLPVAGPARDEPVLRRLQALKGAAFDREYMTRLYRDKRQAVALFQREAGEGADLVLKAFAARTLPVLNAHLKLAQQGDAAGRAVAVTGTSVAASGDHHSHRTLP